MARLQILELPIGANDDRPPFILVVDQCEPQRIALGAGQDATQWRDYWQVVAEQIGARGVIVAPDTVEIPANEVTVTDGQVVRLHVEGDFTQFREQAEQAIRTVQARVANGVALS